MSFMGLNNSTKLEGGKSTPVTVRSGRDKNINKCVEVKLAFSQVPDRKFTLNTLKMNK